MRSGRILGVLLFSTLMAWSCGGGGRVILDRH